MSLPTDVKNQICELIWTQADTMDWVHMSIPQKTQQYEHWSQDKLVGVKLSHYMPIERVHPYIKDSLMKPYAKQKKLGTDHILKLCSAESSLVVGDYIKPHGVRLDDGRIICWGRAVEWKIILLSLYERALFQKGCVPFAAILSDTSGKFSSSLYREVVDSAAKLLGISNIIYGSVQNLC